MNEFGSLPSSGSFIERPTILGLQGSFKGRSLELLGSLKLGNLGQAVTPLPDSLLLGREMGNGSP